MKLEQLPYILEIASCQNLSGAAQKLGISQPALSKYLSNLEGELGIIPALPEKAISYPCWFSLP